MAAMQIISTILDSVAPMWVELSCVLFFLLGFVFLRIDVITGRRGKGKKVAGDDARTKTKVKLFNSRLAKTIEVEAAAHHPKAVLTAWRAGKDIAPTPPELLKVVVQALLDAEPHKLVEEVLRHLGKHSSVLANSKVAVTVLDVVARAGCADLMVQLWEALSKSLGVPPSTHVYEVLLGGFASVGNEQKVKEVTEELRAANLRLSARGYSLTIKGFLKNSMMGAVLQQMQNMQQHGFHVPPFAIVQLFRIACEAKRVGEALDAVKELVVPPAEAIALILEDCARSGDFDLARRVEKLAREENVPLLCVAYDSLLKLYTVAGDLQAMQLFEEMQSSGSRISEGLCIGLLARCADSKFLRFAEEIVKFVRARGFMTIALYSALMKVYAYCGMYDKACDLYDRIREDNLEPDMMMYGCLMKFSVECGRTKLSQELSDRAPSLDIQNYMSLIRAAGRDRDVDRAFAVLKRLQATGMTLDIAAYNCVLDVCVSAGDMRRARELIQIMKEVSTPDVITYNTLLKGYCSSGDLSGAKALLSEMEKAGLPPNDVSYNCLVNTAVTRGNGDFREAWDIIDKMDSKGVAPDHFTVSIMMKALRKVKNPKDVDRALALLDRTGLDVCSEEILLNTVLETCIRHRQCRRLEAILDAYTAGRLRPSVHTYGSLIKACSTLRLPDRCWEFWREMQEHRAMEPNDIVLGCMLDALVCNSRIDEAMELFAAWKVRVPPNAVIYSTLIKGFAGSRMPEHAMKAWRDMREEGIQINTVVYNCVIDAQARVGAMDQVSELVEMMDKDGCQPDVVTCSTIVKGYCVKGDLDKAFEVFRGMQNNNMAGDSIIYNTVLDGCIQQNRMDLADKLLEDMEAYNVTPSNFTLGILVKMYGRRRQLDKAFEVVGTVQRRHGLSPNAKLLTCLMCACINNHAVDRAVEVFEDLRTLSQGPDARAYGALISGLVRHGWLGKAISMVEEAYGLGSSAGCARRGDPGQVMDSEPVEHLMRVLSQRGLMAEKGVPLMERLRAAKAPISGRVFASVLGGGHGAAVAEHSAWSGGGDARGNGGPHRRF